MGGGRPERELAGLLDVLARVIPAAYASYNEVSAEGIPLVAMVAPEPSQRLLAAWGRHGHSASASSTTMVAGAAKRMVDVKVTLRAL